MTETEVRSIGIKIDKINRIKGYLSKIDQVKDKQIYLEYQGPEAGDRLPICELESDFIPTIKNLFMNKIDKLRKEILSICPDFEFDQE